MGIMKFVLAGMLSFLVVESSIAAPPPSGAVTVTEVKATPDVVKAGDSFNVTASFDTKENTKVAGYTAYGYGKDIPAGCDKAGWELKPAKISKWDVYNIKKHTWLKDKLTGEKQQLTVSFDTKNWPSGDYKLNMNLTVMVDGKDYYLPVSFTLSIE